jgi:hypothetical protein
MLQIDIGTINIDNVSQAGSVNIGNTLNVKEPPPCRARKPEEDRFPGEKGTKRVKKRMPASGRRRGGVYPLPAWHPPCMWQPFSPVFGWIPIPFFHY